MPILGAIGALWVPKLAQTTKWQKVAKKCGNFAASHGFTIGFAYKTIVFHCISRTLMKISENFFVSPNLSIQSAPITPKIYTKPVLYMIPKSLEQIFEKLFLKKVMGIQK